MSSSNMLAYIREASMNFLCGDIEEDFKSHLMSWNKVCMPVRKGGVGIRKPASFLQQIPSREVALEILY